MNVKEEILDYINCNEVNGALLLTGPWGCGKSHLIKQISNELNQDKKAAVAVISLFGLDSISAINKRVKDEYIAFKLGTMGQTAKKVSKKLATLAKDGLAVAGTASPDTHILSAASQGLSSALSYDIFNFIEIQNFVGNNDKKRKFVIVFDDLERCGICREKDLLGVLNDFVENKQIKIIIVADEDKINGNDHKAYKEYKEKLISRTICMSADYEYIIKSIVNSYTETSAGYQNFLIQNQDLLKQVFFESKSFNIRTLKCILADFERIYATWTNTNVPTENLKWALYTFGAEAFLSKTQKTEENTSDNAPFFTFNQVKEKQYANYGKNKSNFFSFTQWINHGIWNIDDFVDELNSKYCEKNETTLFRFLTYRFWDLQQQDIDEGLPQAVQLAYEGMLSKDQLISLVAKVHVLNEYKITIPISVDYQKIEKGFDQRLINIQSGKVDEPRSHTFIEKSQVDNEAYSLFQKIKKYDNVIITTRNREKYILYLNGDNSISEYSINGMYVGIFDNEWKNVFLEKYTLACNTDKLEYAQTLLSLSFDYYDSSTKEITKENFINLIESLEKMEIDDVITRLINQDFIKQIKEKFKIQ